MNVAVARIEIGELGPALTPLRRAVNTLAGVGRTGELAGALYNYGANNDADRALGSLASGTPDEMKLLERSARLQRDFLMAPLLRGTKGASRRARRGSRCGDTR